jgi:methylmalonyl-CoA/ethylmalonyl-CoA epimerase
MMPPGSSPVAGGKFDHLGVVVKSITKGQRSIRETLNVVEWTTPVLDSINGVEVVFGRDAGGMVYELVAPIDESSPVYGALAARKNLLNHVAYLVADLGAAAAQMRALGCAPTSDPKPALAYENHCIQFFVTPLSIVVELIEAPQHQHNFQLKLD